MASKTTARVIASHGIKLTAQETSLFSLVRSVALETKTTARVAGGWVRDKILGIASTDVDIAVDSMSGMAFASLLAAKDTTNASSRAPTRIKANPDQSKHLETANVKLNGMDVDVVHLRSETYAADSRIPVVDVGTAKEDAFRRDLTINALFYNINEDVVEDFTGLGYEDLMGGIVRTPLPPLTTFLDDPLRVLRSLRFMHRYGFRMDESTRRACKHDRVRSALALKVSRERVGTEMMKIVKGPRAVEAFEMCFRLGLHDVVFALPSNAGPTDADLRWRASVQYLERLRNFRGIVMRKLPDGAPFELVVIGTALMSFADATYAKPRKRKELPITDYVILQSLKWPKRMCADVRRVVVAAQGLRDMMTTTRRDKVFAASLLRGVGELWPTSWAVAFACCADDDDVSEKTAVGLLDWIEREDLPRISKLHSPLNGRALIRLGVPSGPSIGVVTKKIYDWLALHPDGTAKDCEIFVRGLVSSAAASDK